jgi:hypothetical protein
MAEDWRVTVTLHDEGGIHLLEALREVRLEGAIRKRLEGRVSVSAGGPGTFFAYADTEEAARAAAAVVTDELARRGVEADIALERWHPIEERWEPPTLPLPRTPEEREVERQRLMALETAESEETGVPRWEVRVEVDDHAAARELAERLEREGLPVDRRWRYLLVGAPNEDEARALAERLRTEAPKGANVEVEPSGGAVWEVWPGNPFAIFGGMGV